MKSRYPAVAAVVVALGMSVVATASASAQVFKAKEAPSTLTGKSTDTQVFTTNGGTVECSTAKTTGTIASKETSEQKVTVKYEKCKAFGFAEVSISPAEYEIHANGEVAILNTIDIELEVPFLECSVTVGKQTGLKSVSFTNKSEKILEESKVADITYTSSGGLCGSSGTNGTYTGNNEIEGGKGLEWVS